MVTSPSSDVFAEMSLTVPKVSDPANYHDEVYRQSYVPGVPSFVDFLEATRGVPRDTFSVIAWDIIGLMNEFAAYNAMVAGFVKYKQQEAQAKVAAATGDEQLSGMSLPDLMATRNMMASQMDRLDGFIATAAQLLVEPAPSAL